MYQYCIKIQHKQGIPFETYVCDYLDVVLIHLDDIIKRDKRYNRTFFVNNSFYKNEIPFAFAQNKYEVLARKVGEWEHFENFDLFLK